MLDNEYKVYIKINSDNNIIEINSSAFISDVTDWIEIDCGAGYDYRYAKNYYLALPLISKDGTYNYKYENNKIVLSTDAEKDFMLLKVKAQQEISELKTKLALTDYIIIKIAEGAATYEDYKEEIEERATWRRRINELQNIYDRANVISKNENIG